MSDGAAEEKNGEKESGVSSLLDLIHDQVRDGDEEPRLRTTGLVERIGERVESLARVGPLEPDMGEIVDVVSREMEEVSGQVRFHDVGTVQHIGSGVATLSGLPGASTDELVTFPTGVQGLILNLDHARIDVIMLGPEEGIQGGDLVTSTGRRVRVPVGHQLLGRVIDPLGNPLDEKGPIRPTDTRFLEREAPDIVERAAVVEPLQTGTIVIDALFPIGRGQRELILGDRQTGKTTLAMDAILNQRHGDVSCIYVAIGQKKTSVLRAIDTLRRHNAMRYTTVVIASPEDPAALRYLAPYAGCTIGEFLMDEGRDVLIVYDDLSKHADAYRELSLLLRRPPGREAYPGDIFYLHARLLERACKVNGSLNGGSMTALPIVETKRGNISAYIPTNLISITDGQIYLDTDLFNQGVKPAVNIGQSVSRVGGKAQTEAMKEVAGEMRLELSQYEEVARFARFGTEVEETTQRQIERGKRLRTVLKQPPHAPFPLVSQIVILLAVTEGVLDAVPLDKIATFRQELISHVRDELSELLQQVERTGQLPQETKDTLLTAIRDFTSSWREAR